MTTILLVRPMSQALERALDDRYTVLRLHEAPDAERFLREAGAEVRAVVIGGATPFPETLWGSLPKLELIAVHGVGTDNIDLNRAADLGVAVTITENALTDDVADLAIGLWLAVERRICAGDRFVRRGAWGGEPPFALARRPTGRAIGIVGLGKIGRAISARCKPFSSNIRYFGRNQQPDREEVFVASLEELAAVSDVLFVAASGGRATAGLIDAQVLSALGGTGILVNVARGSVVDEAALVEALEQGRLGGAGLDVFVDEPRVPSSLIGLDNVVLQPHLGSATVEARAAMERSVLDSLSRRFPNEGAPRSKDLLDRG
jgi:hydroxypyruvate reductase